MAIKDDMLAYRARHNISMKELARRCNVTLQTVYSIENGLQEPSRLTREKIRLVLDEKEE